MDPLKIKSKGNYQDFTPIGEKVGNLPFFKRISANMGLDPTPFDNHADNQRFAQKNHPKSCTCYYCDR